MTKQEYYRYIQVEVYEDRKMSIVHKIWYRYLKPETNAVFLIRRYLYLVSQSWGGIPARLICVVLMRRYGIFVSNNTEIGLGLKLGHPFGIIMTNVTIGKNFTAIHDVTLGVNRVGEYEPQMCPHIGDNVTMYAGSMAIGPVTIGDNVEIAANSVVISDAIEPGIYAGSPARKVK